MGGLKRFGRALAAIFVTQIPQVIELLPAPYNLLVAPILMGITKGLRNAFPDAEWVRYIPF